MTLSLHKITHSTTYALKYYDFIKYLRENEHEYKLLGKYEIDKHAELTTELLDNVQHRYDDESTSCCINDNLLFESQFQLLKEIVGQHEKTFLTTIPPSMIEKMDEKNKEVAKIWNTQGVDAAVEEMTKGLRDGTMDYATMRSLYG